MPEGTDDPAGSSGPVGVTRYLADAVVPCDGTDTVHRPGVLDVGADGRIVHVGAVAGAPTTHGPVHDLGGLLMPGLINAHAHTPMTLVRSAGDGLPLQRWLTEVIWPREGAMTDEDVYWGMVLGSIEMLRAGVTTSCEMYLHDAAMIDAVEATGARMVVTPGVVRALHGDDLEGRIAGIADLHAARHRPESGIVVGFAPHSPYDLEPEMVRDIAAEARRLGTIVHVHLEETRDERQQVLDTHGCTATRLLADHGVFDGPVVAAHGVWLDDDDRRILAEAGAAVAHCPQSNLKLGSGVAPVVALRGAGVTVALGTDGPASNDDLDLWEELRLAPMLARGTALDPAALGVVDALSMATRDGGRAVGWPEIGELRAGAWADMCRIDLDQPAYVPVTEPRDLLAHLVWAGSSRHVTDVWVAGRHVVAGGECLGMDRAEACAEVARRGARLAR